MANSLLTIDMVTKEMAVVLENNLAFAKNVTKGYDDSFAKTGAKIGDSLRLRLPPRYTLRTGATLSVQDHTETKSDLKIQTQIGVDVNFSIVELTLSIDEFSQRILEPAVSTISNKVDLDGLAEYKNVYHQVGTAGTTPATALVLLESHRKMNDSSAPMMKRFAAVNPAANVALIDGLKGLFNNQSNINQQYRTGLMANNTLGFDEIGMDQNVNSHTVGTKAGTPLVNGASQTGSSLVTDGWTASSAILKKGDIFTLASVFKVNPKSYASTADLQQFVVTADISADGTGNATIAISPPITITGSSQTVTVSPADNAAITVVGTASTVYPINMAYQQGAFVLGTADLELPQGVHFAGRQVHEGMSISIVRAFDINTYKTPCRLDLLYGWLTHRPDLACRIIG